MKYTLKDVSYTTFFNELKGLMGQIETLLDKNEANVAKLKVKADNLILAIEKYLKANVFPLPVEILEILVNSYSRFPDFDLSYFGAEKRTELDKELERIERFKDSFYIVIGYLAMIESLSNAEFDPVNWKISEKNDFILSKLNTVFGDQTYSVEKILKINDIQYRGDEGTEIAEDLAKRGYLLLENKYGKNVSAKISVKGARYIERKLSNNKSKKDDSLNKKLDDILKRLTKLGYGQEILFDEIEELRNLQEKLSKKSWGQLLKGKLIDLALDKVISTETAKIVYEYLTNGNFKLLDG